MSEIKQTILIAAGGTGGHMFPAKAFADEMVARGFDIILVTDPRGKRYTEGFPSIDNLILSVTNADEGGLKGKINAGLNLLKSISQTKPFLKKHSPVAVVGFGGYPTFPVLYNAKCPVIIHEQNAVLGRVNRFFQKKAVKICSGFETLNFLEYKEKHVVCGNPVRKELIEAGKAPFPEIKPNGTLRILVTGGSQGARVLGQAVPDAIAELPENLRQRLFVSHQVREEQCDTARETYGDAGVQAEVWPFFKDMATRLKDAHLVIGRSGASTVSETAVVGRSAIFIPLPSATNYHQTYNAESMVKSGGADLIKENELSVKRLSQLLEMRLMNEEKLKERGAAIKNAARPDAAQRLADVVIGEINA